MIYARSKMTSLYYDSDDADENHPCVVKLTADEIIVEYREDTLKLIQYRGVNDGSGHFELRADAIDGRGTLHIFPGASLLEGSWIEGNVRGMWRIQLA